jgi:TonB-linked SusC/RagA family outer membrane protein
VAAQGNAEVLAVTRRDSSERPTPNLDRVARLQVVNASLASAVQGLALSSGVPIAYSAKLLADKPWVTCDCRDQTVRQALAIILGGTGLTFSESAGQVLIEREAVPAALATGGAAAGGRAFVGSISGQVTDSATHSPLQGSEVYLTAVGAAPNARTQGAITNGSGRYTITGVPAGEVQVRVRMIGYEPMQRRVTVRDGAATVVDFALGQALLRLNQVVVTGVAGGVERRAIGNVVETVSAADVLATGAPVLNVEQTLSGRTAGLIVLPPTGQVGTGAQMHVRGVSSMALSNDPIVYIDGVRMDADAQQGPGQRGGAGVGRLNDINPDDIESIEVIKGPAAGTIYGTQASNGVIQIITKKGKAGAPVWNFMARVGTNWMQNGGGRTQNTYALDPKTNTIVSENIWNNYISRGNGPIFGAGLAQGYNLSLTGGTDAIRYFASLGRDDDVGVVPWNYQRKLSARANLDIPVNTAFKLSFSASYVPDVVRLAQGSINSDPFSNLIWGSPLTLNAPQQGFFAAPPSVERQIVSRADNDRTTTSMTATYFPFTWLTNRLVVGIDYNSESNWTLIPLQPLGAASVLGSTGTGSKSVDEVGRTFTTVDYSASAKYGTERLRLTSSFGFQYYNSVVHDINATGVTFPATPITTVSGGATTTGSETYAANSEVGLYLEQQIAWRDRLFVTVAVRGDNNSAFGSQYKAAYYPKISAAWVLSEESFFKVKPVNELRLRFAYGAAGTQPGTFDATRTYSPDVGYKDQPALVPNAIGNPTLQPERSTELESGFESSLFGNRLELIYSHYSRVINHAIVNEPVPPSNGFPGNQVVNIGKVNAWGDELSATFHAVRGRNFSWDVGTQLSDNANQIKDLGPFKFLTVGQGGQGQNRLGFSIADVFMYKVLGATISPTTGAVLTSTCDGGTGNQGLEQGGAPVACSSAPRVLWGHSQPSWQAGLNNTFTLWRDLRLSVRIEGNGGMWNDDTEIRALHNLGLSMPVILHNDPIVQAYRAIDPDATGTFLGGFLRLREVAGAYTMSPRLAKTWFRANAATLSVGARNLVMLWTAANGWNTRRDGQVTVPVANMKAWDPEQRGVGQLSGGYQTILPPTANATLTIRLTY